MEGYNKKIRFLWKNVSFKLGDDNDLFWEDSWHVNQAPEDVVTSFYSFLFIYLFSETILSMNKIIQKDIQNCPIKGNTKVCSNLRQDNLGYDL